MKRRWAWVSWMLGLILLLSSGTAIAASPVPITPPISPPELPIDPLPPIPPEPPSPPTFPIPPILPPIDLPPVIPLPPDPTPVTCTSQTFSDLPVDHPACGAVRVLTEAGIVNGFPDGTFRPEQTVTRAEFAKMFILVRSLVPRPGESLPFRDTDGHWAAVQGYLQAAVADGAINGFPDGTFRPNDLVTRAQGVKIAAAGLPRPERVVAPMMPIDVTADLWYYGSVEFALIQHLMGPEALYPVYAGVTFGGDTRMTRGEAAMLLANLLFAVQSTT